MENTSINIAKHLREVYFGGNWTYSCLKDAITNLDFNLALRAQNKTNSIAILVEHLNYYTVKVSSALDGQKFDAKDELSFSLPNIKSQKDWDQFVIKVLEDGRRFADQLESFDDKKLGDSFLGLKKYGSYYRNFHGIIEHAHYHLGQIVILKKIYSQNEINEVG